MSRWQVEDVDKNLTQTQKSMHVKNKTEHTDGKRHDTVTRACFNSVYRLRRPLKDASDVNKKPGHLRLILTS